MPRNEQKLYEMARAHWCAPGERLAMGDRAAGHIGGAVGGRIVAPYPPIPGAGGPVPDPGWPLPTEPVGTGRIWNDEWADDPVIWGWAHAPGAGAAAAGLAGHMAGYGDEAWLLLTDRRLAVTVESRFARPAGPSGGGLRGRARALLGDRAPGGDRASGDDRASGGDRPAGGEHGPAPAPDAPLTTCWQVPYAAVRGLRAVALGRCNVPERFVRVDFADGSAFDFRPRRGADASKYVASVSTGLP